MCKSHKYFQIYNNKISLKTLVKNLSICATIQLREFYQRIINKSITEGNDQI